MSSPYFRFAGARLGLGLCALLILVPLPSGVLAQGTPARAAVKTEKASPASPGQAALTKKYASRLAVPIALTDGKRSVKRTRKQLGFKLDFKRMQQAGGGGVLFSVDENATRKALARVAKTFNRPAVDAKPYIAKGRVVIAKSASGQSLDVAKTARQLASTAERQPATQRLRVSLIQKEPNITAARLKGITGSLANFSTRAGGNAKRLNNIQIAVRAIDGTLLAPGETFSLNQTVGERTSERGYRTAPVFVDAEKVDGIGGGVSQVTGTLFNAAALAGLAIDEVHPHSRPVSYLPLGRDATVAFGSKDLKFTNNTKAPVYIGYTLKGRRLSAVVFGQRQPTRKIKLVPQVKKKGPGNITAQLYRNVSQSGKTQKEQLFSHTYRWKAKG